MNPETKEIAEALAPVIKEAVKEEIQTVNEASEEKETANQKTIKELQETIAEIKTASKKFGETGTEGQEKAGAFLKAFLNGDLAEAKTLSEGVDDKGGYLVPTEFHKEIVRVAKDSGFARKYARTIPMGTDSKNIVDLVAGVQAYVVGENIAITPSDLTLGNTKLEARKFAVLNKATQELIEDNMSNIEILKLVAEIAVEAIVELEDTQMFLGNGTGNNALGIFNDTNVNIYSLPATKTSFEDITAKDLIKIKGSVKNKLKKKSKGKVVWAMNEEVFNIIEALEDSNGRPLFKESMKEADSYTLLGYPVEIIDVLPGIVDDGADTKFLCFGAFNFFFLGDRKRITTEIGYAAGDFEKDVKSQKIIERVALLNVIPKAFVVAKTAAT